MCYFLSRLGAQHGNSPGSRLKRWQWPERKEGREGKAEKEIEGEGGRSWDEEGQKWVDRREAERKKDQEGQR